MRPGLLNTRIEIIQATDTTDNMGGYTSVWSIYKTVWGQFKPMKAREKMESDQVQNPIEAIIRIRYTTGITEAMRARINGIVYEIESAINVDNANREIELIVSKLREDEGD